MRTSKPRIVKWNKISKYPTKILKMAKKNINLTRINKIKSFKVFKQWLHSFWLERSWRFFWSQSWSHICPSSADCGLGNFCWTWRKNGKTKTKTYTVLLKIWGSKTLTKTKTKRKKKHSKPKLKLKPVFFLGSNP